MKNVDEEIDAAAAALREQTETPVSELEAARTRARILATHRAGQRRAAPITWLAAAAAIVIVLGGSTAWAYWTGRIAAWTSIPSPSPALSPSPAPSPSPSPAPSPSPETLPTVAPAELVAPEVVETAPERTPTPVDPRERAAYRAAHALHFEQHDPAGAIAAWDTYLAAYPSGRFALEARYNRALCLVRLGRTSEARAALTPFVQGTHGGYRQQEATALAQALDAQP